MGFFCINTIMLEFRNPIPVITPLGEGYAIYTTNSGTFENDVNNLLLLLGYFLRSFLLSYIRDIGVHFSMFLS